PPTQVRWRTLTATCRVFHRSFRVVGSHAACLPCHGAGSYVGELVRPPPLFEGAPTVAASTTNDRPSCVRRADDLDSAMHRSTLDEADLPAQQPSQVTQARFP